MNTYPLSESKQDVVMNSICHEAFMVGQAWQHVAYSYERPSVLWEPKLFIDGNQWCALYGENIQEGVAGFGVSPEMAMYDFDKNWARQLEG
jgi:hypothetical protein